MAAGFPLLSSMWSLLGSPRTANSQDDAFTPEQQQALMQPPGTPIPDSALYSAQPQMQPPPAPASIGLLAQQPAQQQMQAPPMGPQAPSLNDPVALERYKKLTASANQAQLDGLDAQKKSIGDLSNSLDAAKNREMPLNLQPLAALTDAWSGSQMAPYAAPSFTQKEKDQYVERLQQALGKAQQGYSADQVNLLRSQAGDDLAMQQLMEKVRMDKEQNALEGKKLDILGGKPGQNYTPAEKKVDEAFAKNYDEDVLQGGLAKGGQEVQGLRTLSDKIGRGAYGKISGPTIGSLPDTARAGLYPGSVQAQEEVQRAVQGSLKQIFGSRVSTQEALLTFQRVFNPRLPPEENVRRMNVLADSLQSAMEAKASANKYYEQHGTVKGFKGMDAVYSDFESKIKSLDNPSSNSNDAEIQALEAEAKKRGIN